MRRFDDLKVNIEHRNRLRVVIAQLKEKRWTVLRDWAYGDSLSTALEEEQRTQKQVRRLRPRVHHRSKVSA